MKKLFFVALILCAVSFAQTNVARMLSGVNAQTGTSYTFDKSDVTKIVTFNNANPVGATLPVGTTTGFGAGSVFTAVDLGAGTVTISCSGCTINGAASVQVVQNSSVSLYGDGTNYISASGGGGGGGASIAGSTALGTQVGGNGAGGFASTSKPILDPRDFGVDCSGSTDSSTALNTLLTVIGQREVDIPQDCQIRVDHQIVIQSQSAWVIKGKGDRPGPGGFGGPSIYGCNGSAGPLLYINRSGYGRIEGIGIYPKGPTGVCASSSFTQSVQIDSTGNPGVTTHDIILDHVALTSSPAGVTIANYIGLSITDGGKQNGEFIRVRNSWIHCQNSSGSIGIDLENPTSDKDKFEDNNISSCFIGVKHAQGNATIQGNMFTSTGNFSVFGSGGGAIWLGSCSSGPVNILNNEADSTGQFINSVNDAGGGQGCTGGVNVIGNDIGVSDYDTANVYPINLGTTTAAYIVEGNQINLSQAPSGPVVGSKSQGTSGPQGSIVLKGNTFQNANGTAFGFCCQSPGFQFGQYELGSSAIHSTFTTISSTFDVLNFGTNKFGFPSPFTIYRSSAGAGGINDDWAIENVTGNTPTNTSSLIIAHTKGQTGTAFAAIDGSLSGLTLSPITAPAAPAIQQVGGGGSTSYTYAVCAVTSSGQVCGATSTSATGPATLNGTTYNQIQTPGTSGTLKYCFYRTASSGTPSSTGQIGCIPAAAFPNAKLGYSANYFGTSAGYLFNDTGLAGNSAALPVGNTTGVILTAASTTGAAGLNLPHGTAPTTPNNGDIWTTPAGLFAQVNGGTVGPMGSGGGGGLSGMTTLGMPIATSPTNIATSTVPGTNQGTYILGRFNSVQGVATAPIEIQAGDCSTPGVISGASATYTIQYTDVIGCNVVHDILGSQSATITIPNPATLNNPAPTFNYTNNSTHADTLTPSTYQISMGSAAAGASLSVPSNVSCKVQLDPVNGSTYKADCHLISTTSPTTTYSGSATVAVSAGTGVSAAPNGTTLIADGSGNAIPRPAVTTVGLGGVWSNGMPLGSPVAVGVNSTLVNGTMYVQQINLVAEQTIGNATFNMITCAACAEVINACMYNSAGSTLLWSGITATINGTGAFSATGTQATLVRGVYYFAYSASGGGVSVIQGYSTGGSSTDNILNKNGTREGTAANGISAGACPATLGALAGATTSPAKGTFALEP